jgi:hypothetical protein
MRYFGTESRFDSGQAYFSSLPGVDIHSEYNITSILFTWVHYTNTVNIMIIYCF